MRIWSFELTTHDPDHAMLDVIEPQRSTDDAFVAIEVLAPEAVRKDDGRRGIPLGIRRCEGPAVGRLDAEKCEVIVGNADAPQTTRPAWCFEPRRRQIENGDLLECRYAFAPVVQAARGDAVRGRSATLNVEKHHQRIAARIRQRAEQHSVDA